MQDLPYTTKVKTIMYIYKNQYESISYLQDQSQNFLSWICPLLKQIYVPMDQYIYQESDQIVEIYFVTRGYCGFVLPLGKNVVYIAINQGDFFGEIDFVFEAQQADLEISNLVQYYS